MKTIHFPWVCSLAVAAMFAGGCGLRTPHQLREPRFENPESPPDHPRLAAARAARAALPQTASLQNVVTLAALHNPMASAAWYRMSAAQELRPQATAWPDPMIEGQYFFRRGDTHYMLMLSQTLPFPTKLLIEGDRADRQAAAAALQYDRAVRDAIAESKMAYFDLYYIDRAQAVTAALAELYARYAALAAGDAAPQPAPMPGDPPPAPTPRLPELFRAQSQLAQARYDLALLAEMRAAQAQKLLAALGQPPETAVGLTEDLPPPPALGVTLPELRAQAAAANQELAILQLEKERADLAVDAAQHAPLPDLELGVTYADMTMLPTDKDPIGVTVGLSLPLWWGKYSAMRREAGQMARAMAAEQQNAALQLNANLAQAWFSLQNSSRLVRLYEQTLLPQARQALRSAEEQHRVGNTSLLALLEATAAVHNFELAHLRATADFYLQTAKIEQLVGAPLTLAAADEPPSSGNPAVPTENLPPAPSELPNPPDPANPPDRTMPSPAPVLPEELQP